MAQALQAEESQASHGLLLSPKLGMWGRDGQEIEDYRISEQGEGKGGGGRQQNVLRLQRICSQDSCHRNKREVRRETSVLIPVISVLGRNFLFNAPDHPLPSRPLPLNSTGYGARERWV